MANQQRLQASQRLCHCQHLYMTFFQHQQLWFISMCPSLVTTCFALPLTHDCDYYFAYRRFLHMSFALSSNAVLQSVKQLAALPFIVMEASIRTVLPPYCLQAYIV